MLTSGMVAKLADARAALVEASTYALKKLSSSDLFCTEADEYRQVLRDVSLAQAVLTGKIEMVVTVKEG